jgi:6-phosphofructokinase 1
MQNLSCERRRSIVTRERIPDTANLTNERLILLEHLEKGCDLDTYVEMVKNNVSYTQSKDMQNKLGLFRNPNSRKAVIADIELLTKFREKNMTVPSFLEAGPRVELKFDPYGVRAAIVTTGGLAPGIHCVIHSIVKRHCDTYSIVPARGRIYGIYNSFEGCCFLADNLVELTTAMTEEWLDQGGSKLGIIRYYPKAYTREETTGDEAIKKMIDDITINLQTNRIDILYVIGGDGSLKTAHKLALENPTRSIIGIPKTMDNDVLWIWQTFGFATAVEQATRVINTLRSEAESTRRICVIELFGAESGFVAANAALASGHVDAVLIPEVFKDLNTKDALEYLDKIIDHIGERVEDKDERTHNPHAIVVVAQGVGTILEKIGASIEGNKVKKETFINQLKTRIDEKVVDAHGKDVPVFINQPRHNIRAVPANAHDQIYCERLGALAVDNALAGYTDCMISQWLTEFVLVPMGLVSYGKKAIPINGMFWKQVVSSTGQPHSRNEDV